MGKPRAALMRVHDRYYYLPLHRQMLTWLSRANVRPVILPSNQVRWPGSGSTDTRPSQPTRSG